MNIMECAYSVLFLIPDGCVSLTLLPFVQFTVL